MNLIVACPNECGRDLDDTGGGALRCAGCEETFSAQVVLADG